MFVSDVCHLTTKDYTTLEIMQERSLSGDELMNSILRRKLSRAIVMLGDQIPATVATLGSQVTFRVNEGPAETRMLAGEDFHGLAGLLPVIPISHRRGWRSWESQRGQVSFYARMMATRRRSPSSG